MIKQSLCHLYTHHPDCEVAQQHWIQQLQSLYTPHAHEAQWQLELTPQGFYLQDTQKILSPLHLDFDGGAMAYRLRQKQSTELLTRAVQWQPKQAPKVWDLTAGFGGDGLRLASLGCSMLLIERHPVVAVMLAEAVARAQKNHPSMTIECIQTDAHHWLSQCQLAAPDVILLDPMFPIRRKSAAVKLKAQWLQTLVAASCDDDPSALLQLALQYAQMRVVVKRPLKAAALQGAQATGQLLGRRIRFDIYAPNS